MALRLCPDRQRAAIALISIAMLAVLTTVYAQLLVIALGALLGIVFCRTGDAQRGSEPHPALTALRISPVIGWAALALFFVILLGLPALLTLHNTRGIQMFDAFYRSGALVFGGGHVVLPLLQQQTVATGWIAPSDFLAGYGAAQAVPGPLFTFAAFLGWMMPEAPRHWVGAALATAGIFLPGLLLVIAALPHWQSLRSRPATAAMLSGVNAAVVGLLATALYSPVWVTAVLSTAAFAVAAVCFLLLTRWKVPPFAVVVVGALAGIAEFALR